MERRIYTAFMMNAPYDCDEDTIHIVEWNEDFGGFTSVCGVDGEGATEYVQMSNNVRSWTEGWRRLSKADHQRVECRKCHNGYYHGGTE